MYNSIYDVLKNESTQGFLQYSRFQRYEGTVSDILKNLEYVISKDIHIDANIGALIVQPPRIIRAIIESNPEASFTGKNYHDILAESVRFCSKVYNYRAYSTGELLEDLSNIGKTLEPIHRYEVTQEDDDITWKSSSPKYSEDSANIMYNIFEQKPILFIPLANGAVSAGIDVFMRYMEKSCNENSIIHPVRLSLYKSKDRKPLMHPGEIEFIKKASKERHVVLFDEDSGLGSIINPEHYTPKIHKSMLSYTIINAIRYFNGIIDEPAHAIINNPDLPSYKALKP